MGILMIMGKKDIAGQSSQKKDESKYNNNNNNIYKITSNK